jgi:hypothetical protein
MTAAVVARQGADDDALRSRLGVGRKLHRLRTPHAAGGESARRTSSRFPFPVGTRGGGLLAPPLLCCRLGVVACCPLAPHQLHSNRPEEDTTPPPLNPGLRAPGASPPRDTRPYSPAMRELIAGCPQLPCCTRSLLSGLSVVVILYVPCTR